MNEIPFAIFHLIFLFCAFFGTQFKNPIVQTIFNYIAVFCLGANMMFLIQLLLLLM